VLRHTVCARPVSPRRVGFYAGARCASRRRRWSCPVALCRVRVLGLFSRRHFIRIGRTNRNRPDSADFVRRVQSVVSGRTGRTCHPRAHGALASGRSRELKAQVHLENISQSPHPGHGVERKHTRHRGEPVFRSGFKQKLHHRVYGEFLVDERRAFVGHREARRT